MFRFSIRELLLLTLVVALALGWFVDHVLLSQKVAGIMRLYDSAATRLNAITTGMAAKPETPIVEASH